MSGVMSSRGLWIGSVNTFAFLLGNIRDVSVRDLPDMLAQQATGTIKPLDGGEFLYTLPLQHFPHVKCAMAVLPEAVWGYELAQGEALLTSNPR